MLVHLSGGQIEMHFRFFVVVAVISLYLLDTRVSSLGPVALPGGHRI